MTHQTNIDELDNILYPLKLLGQAYYDNAREMLKAYSENQQNYFKRREAEVRIDELKHINIERFLINCACEARIMHVPDNHKGVKTKEDRILELQGDSNERS